VCCGRDGEDVLAPEVIKDYFERLYSLKCTDREGIAASLEDDCCEWPYERVAKSFRIIDQELRTVLVPYGKWNYSEMNRLLDSEDIKEASRRLQSNVVQIQPRHYQALVRCSAVQFHWEGRFGDRFPYLANTELYDPQYGLHWDDPYYRDAESNIW